MGDLAAHEMAWRIDPAHMISHLTARRRTKTSEYSALRKPMKMYPHTRLLGRKLADAVLGHSPRQIWQLGPRYGKTVVASVAGPVWALDLDPALEVILASYGDDLAQRNGRAARNLLIEHSDVLHVRISRDSTSVDRWNTTEGGGVRAAGVGSALTGFGCDLAIVDDPFKNWEEAQSLLRRDLVWDWFRSVLWTRLQGDRTPVIVVATRWHKDDLSGRLIVEDNEREKRGEPRMWEIVRLPTIADGEARGEPDLLGRADGEPLCPELFSPATVLEQREVLGPLIHRAMHQQDPTDPEGGIFKREWWRYWDVPPDPQDVWAWWSSWDMNFKEGDGNSYVVGQVWCRAGADHFLVDQVRGRWSYVVAKGQMRALLRRYPHITTVLVEDKANGPAIMSDLGGEFAGFRAVTPQGSKESRAHTVSGMVESGHILLPSPGLKPWVEGYVDECVVGSTMIFTRQGLRRADEIMVGDEVLTHKGRFRPVTATRERKAPETVTLRAKQLDPLTLTPDHPVLAQRHRRFAIGQHFSPDETAWVPAGEMSPRRYRMTERRQYEAGPESHDALTIPALDPDFELTEIDLRAFYDATLPAPDNYKGRKGRTWQVIDDGETIVVNIARAQSIRYRQVLDHRFGRLCGLFLAEGSYSKPGRAYWSFHEDEVAFHEEVRATMLERLGLRCNISPLKGSRCVNVWASAPRLEAFFRDFGWKAPNKRIPPWAWEAPAEFVRGMIEGWLDGDGNKNAQGVCGVTVSPHLAWGMRLLATRIGLWPGLTCRGPAKPTTVKNFTITPRHSVYRVMFEDGDRAGCTFDGELLGFPLKAADPGGARAVYNFSVAEDESYVTTGGTLHNCADFPNSDHDDQVDATTQYLLHAGGVFAAKRSSYGRARLSR